MEFKSNKGYFKEYSLVLIFKNVIMGIMMAADKIIGAIFIGVNALVATNLIGPLQVIIYAISALFMGGLGSYVGLLLGRKDAEKANRASSLTMLVLTSIMSVITVLIMMYPEKISYFFGARGDILEITSTYLFYVSLGFMPMVLAAAIDIVIMNDGSPKFIMKVKLFSTVLNVMLNLFLVAILKWGIIGLAIATTISNLVHLIISAYYYLFKCKTLKLVAPKLDFEILIRILYNGSSDFIGMFSEGLKRYVINIAIISFLTAKHMEAYSVVSMFVIIFISSVFYGTAQGMQPIFSNMMGAKKFDRLKPLLNYSVRKSNIIALVIFIIAIPFMEATLGLFLNDPETIKIGFYLYLSYGLATLFENLPNAAIMFFTAIKRPLESIVFSISRTVFLLPIFTYISIFALGESGLMIGTLLAEGIMIVATIKYLKPLKFESMLIVE